MLLTVDIWRVGHQDTIPLKEKLWDLKRGIQVGSAHQASYHVGIEVRKLIPLLLVQKAQTDALLWCETAPHRPLPNRLLRSRRPN